MPPRGLLHIPETSAGPVLPAAGLTQYISKPVSSLSTRRPPLRLRPALPCLASKGPSTPWAGVAFTVADLATRLADQVLEAHRLIMTDPTGARRPTDKRWSSAVLNVAFLSMLNLVGLDYQPTGATE